MDSQSNAKRELITCFFCEGNSYKMYLVVIERPKHGKFLAVGFNINIENILKVFMGQNAPQGYQVYEGLANSSIMSKNSTHMVIITNSYEWIHS